MAIAYESIVINDFRDTPPSITNEVFTKPTGLAVGDMMIAVLTYDTNSNDDPTAEDGWTLLYLNETGIRNACFYKIADSDDVAATNFTFTYPSGMTGAGGSLMRWSGVGAITAGSQTRINSSTSTPTFTTGVTPSVANSYLIFVYFSSYTHTVSSYAITTDNPSWTEITDISEAGPDMTMALAYASRPETTATGNFTCTTSTTHDDHFGRLIVLSPQTNVNLSMPVGTLTLSSPTPSLTVDVTLPMTVGTLTLTGNAPTITTSENTVWTEESKNPATWTEENK